MIPLSFIGVFLTFYFFKLGFDQGGFASFLLLSGITVNSALFIPNDYNNIRRKPKYNRTKLITYLKAYNGKIIPVFLTIISTILGLLPFLLGELKEAFWFSLASGTIGGLIFSILAIVIFLPVFIDVKNTIRIKNNKLKIN
jgi:multidrug efflux pump subunit AcrB